MSRLEKSKLAKAAEIAVVWEPIPGTSQELALDSPADNTLYCGTRGPGKTDCQLMAFRRHVGVGYGSFWRGIILDLEYKNLDDLVAKSKRWFPQFEDGAQFLASSNQYKWVWPSGEELLFRSVSKPDDYEDYHGHEYPFIGWNELTKYPDRKLYDMFMSCNRSSWTQEKDSPKDENGNPTLPPIPLKIFSTTNPWGVGMHWVRAEFIDPAPYGTLIKEEIEVFNPQTQREEIIVQTRVAIFGSYKENKYLDPKYIAKLASEKDPNLRAAWLEGSWDIAAGGALSDLWNKNIHVVPRFRVPSNWYVDRTFDWGSTHPFWVGWWAEANGEEVVLTMPDGTKQKWCPPRKSVVLIHEWYGTEKIGTNKGLKLSASKIADRILEIEKQLRDDKWINGQVYPGAADNQIANKTQADEETIEKKMADKKVRWLKSDKRKGSRRNGLQLLRERLEAALDNSGPGVYVMVHNRASIAILPAVPRDPDDPDDVDTNSEDHPYDGWRYRMLQKFRRAATAINVAFANSR